MHIISTQTILSRLAFSILFFVSNIFIIIIIDFVVACAAILFFNYGEIFQFCIFLELHFLRNLLNINKEVKTKAENLLWQSLFSYLHLLWNSNRFSLENVEQWTKRMERENQWANYQDLHMIIIVCWKHFETIQYRMMCNAIRDQRQYRKQSKQITEKRTKENERKQTKSTGLSFNAEKFHFKLLLFVVNTWKKNNFWWLNGNRTERRIAKRKENNNSVWPIWCFQFCFVQR